MLPPLDNEGFLRDLDDWSRDVAVELAARDGIVLGAEHWALIELIRDFYHRYQLSPPMRVLVRQTRETLGPECGNSLYLLKLFPDSPAKRLARIAGLPRPANCL